MNRTLTMLCMLALTLGSTGCTLVVGQLDDRKPGDTGPAGNADTSLGIPGNQLAGHLDGVWMTDCIPGADDQGREYTLTVMRRGENDTEVSFEREDNPGCASNGETWIEYIDGNLHRTMPEGGVVKRGALGQGNDAYGMAFTVSGHGMQLYTSDAVDDANDSRLYGKNDWEAEVDVDLISEVDIGPGALAVSDVMALFIVLDTNDELRLASPVREEDFDPTAPDLELSGALDALIAGSFIRQ